MLLVIKLFLIIIMKQVKKYLLFGIAIFEILFAENHAHGADWAVDLLRSAINCLPSTRSQTSARGLEYDTDEESEDNAQHQQSGPSAMFWSAVQAINQETLLRGTNHEHKKRE